MVGDLLRETRIKKGLSLEDIASRTHIRLDYLRDIENGIFDKIASEIYIRGYLKLYAKIIGLDGDEIIVLYCEERGETGEECKEEIEVPGEKDRFNKLVSVILGILACFLVVLIVVKFDDIKSTFLKKRQTAVPDSGAGHLKPQSLRIIANDTTWIMIVIDNKKVEEYVLKRGDVLVKEGYDGFYLKIGNAGGVSIFLNNENVGYLGNKGKVVKVSIPKNFKLDRAFKHLFQAKKSIR